MGVWDLKFYVIVCVEHSIVGNRDSYLKRGAAHPVPTENRR